MQLLAGWYYSDEKHINVNCYQIFVLLVCGKNHIINLNFVLVRQLTSVKQNTPNINHNILF